MAVTTTQPPSGTPSAAGLSAGVFWDYENCQLPRGSAGVDMFMRLRAVLEAEGMAVSEWKAYGCSAQLTTQRRIELQDLGFDCIDASRLKSKEAADNRIMCDIFRFVLAHQQTRVAIVLISSDSDFAYALSVLRRFGHFIVVLPADTAIPALRSHAHKIVPFSTIVQRSVRPSVAVRGDDDELGAETAGGLAPRAEGGPAEPPGGDDEQAPDSARYSTETNVDDALATLREIPGRGPVELETFLAALRFKHPAAFRAPGAVDALLADMAARHLVVRDANGRVSLGPALTAPLVSPVARVDLQVLEAIRSMSSTSGGSVLLSALGIELKRRWPASFPKGSMAASLERCKGSSLVIVMQDEVHVTVKRVLLSSVGSHVLSMQTSTIAAESFALPAISSASSPDQGAVRGLELGDSAVGASAVAAGALAAADDGPSGARHDESMLVTLVTFVMHKPRMLASVGIELARLFGDVFERGLARKLVNLGVDRGVLTLEHGTYDKVVGPGPNAAGFLAAHGASFT